MWNHPGSDIRSGDFPPHHVRRWIRRQSDSSRAASVCCVSTQWAARSFADDYAIPRDRVAVVGMGHRPRSAAAGDKDWSKPTFLFVGVTGSARTELECWKHSPGCGTASRRRRCTSSESIRSLMLPASSTTASFQRQCRQPRAPRPAVRGGDVLCPTQQVRPVADLLPGGSIAGIPVIATPFGGAGELLGRGAWTVDPSDSGSIAEAMVRLSAPQQARAMGEAAAQVAATASWTNVAGRILDALSATAPTTGAGSVSGGSRAGTTS